MLGGTITNVTTKNAGSSNELPAAAGDSVLQLVNLDSFVDVGGQVIVDEEHVTDYVVVDRVMGTISLATPLPFAVEAGIKVETYPLTTTKVASVLLDGNIEGDDVPATVKYGDDAALPVGVRDPESRELCEVEVAGGEYEVARILNQRPVLQAAMLDEVPLPTTDGLAPEFQPIVRITRGIGTVILEWDPVSNRDPVRYRVWGGFSSGFVRSESTLLGETSATQLYVGSLWDVGAASRVDLTPGTTYYFDVAAVDEDGQGPVTQVSGSPGQVQQSEIAPGAIGIIQIEDLSLTARKFKTQTHQLY